MNDTSSTPATSASTLSVEEALTIASRLMQDMAISMIGHQTAEARKAADNTTSTSMEMQKSAARATVQRT